MPEIVITIRNKIATASVRSIVCDNTDYTVRLDCDAQWSAGPKIVYFLLQGVGALAPATTADDVCALPPIRLSDGVGRQLAVGVQQGTVKTSTTANLWCYPSAESALMLSAVEDNDVSMTWLEWVNRHMAEMPEVLAAAEDAAREAADVRNEMNAMYDTEAVDYAGIPEVNLSDFTVSALGVWRKAGTGASRSYTFPIDTAVKKIVVRGEEENGSVIAFLNSYDPVFGETVDFSEQHTERVEIGAGETREFVVGETMNYLYALLKNTEGDDTAPIVTIAYIDTDGTLSSQHVPADAKAVGDAIWNGRGHSLTPHTLVYYGVGTTATNVLTELPLDSWCYAQWQYVSGAFADMGGPDLGFDPTTYVSVEKRAVSNAGGVFDLTIRPLAKSGKTFVCRANPTSNRYDWFYPDATLSKPQVPADAKAVGDAIKNQTETKPHYYSADAESGWVITGSSIWSKITSGLSRSKIFRIPAGATGVSVTPAASGNTVFTFLKSYEPVNGETPDFAAGWSRTSISGESAYEYALGSDCRYMYATVTTSTGANVTPTAVTFTCLRTPDGDECRLEPRDTDDADDTGKHDRSAEIMLALNQFGVCRMSPGIYYVSGITMPAKSSIIGEGRGTDIRLLSSVAAGSAITMGSQCSVRSLTISGAYSNRAPATDQVPEVGTRNGVEWSGEDMDHGSIENCCVQNFAGAGLYLHDTTSATHKNLAISDCYFAFNDAGIDIRKNSEFNRIVNCTFYKNYIGYRNRGGNNNISNCGIDWNIKGLLIDNAEGSNGGHGTITGCSINHSNYANTLNGRPVGDGIVVEGTGRMVISNCNVYYSKLKLIDTNGNVVSNIGFGNLASLEISGGECSIIANCMFRRAQTSTDPDPVEYEDFPITITDNTAAKIFNCFDRNGYEYEQA